MYILLKIVHFSGTFIKYLIYVPLMMKIPDICPADDDQRNEVLEEAETVLVPLQFKIS